MDICKVNNGPVAKIPALHALIDECSSTVCPSLRTHSPTPSISSISIPVVALTYRLWQPSHIHLNAQETSNWHRTAFHTLHGDSDPTASPSYSVQSQSSSEATNKNTSYYPNIESWSYSHEQNVVLDWRVNGVEYCTSGSTFGLPLCLVPRPAPYRKIFCSPHY
jgi:hypothetical protein